ncbi:MAG: hypothetical protein CMJ42_16290 [Phyllobacteriaceae bacterium]|nr:hypothetical protein [Phyllobacteriaceae bacterium]MBA89255.1 hypothetical protein [Phyllobacteriaceae bacterium]
MSNQKNNRPTASVFMVEGDGDKAIWTEIGALWKHEDGHGANVQLKAIPVSGRLVIRDRKSKADSESAGQ